MARSRSWNRETIEHVRDALANASDPPSKLSTREAVEELADEIRAKRAAGWRRRDIVAFLKDHGVDIPEATLRTYTSGGDAGIERPPGASDTRPGPTRPAKRSATGQADDQVAYIEQDDV